MSGASLNPSLVAPTAPVAEALPVPARTPTGVPDFDYFLGGVPAGSVILLIGEAGAGHAEFALTSAVQLMRHAEDPLGHPAHLGSAPGPFRYPEGILYISLTRSRSQVVDEARATFDGSHPAVLERHLDFRDLSPCYFSGTSVPAAWAEVENPLLGGGGAPSRSGSDPLHALTESIDPGARDRVTIVDSLTDLIVRPRIDPMELVTVLKGLRRRAKDWGGIVYLLLSRGVAPPAVEQAIIDSVDGVLSFEWTTSPSRSHRQRVLIVERFMPVLARMPEENQGKFVVRVQPLTGLVTTQHERI